MAGIKLLPLAAVPRQWWPDGANFAADFVGNRYMRGGAEVPAAAVLSFARGSGKYVEDASGRWRPVDSGVLGRSGRGALLEGAAAELIANNTITGQQPAIGLSAFGNGWFRTGVLYDFAALLMEQDICGIVTQPFRINGGAVNGFEGWQTSAIPHVSGQDYTLSIYARVPPGKNATSLYWYAPVGLSGTHLIANEGALTRDWQRFDLTRTASAAGAANVQVIKVSAVDTDYAVDFALPMLRAGAASSFIMTTGSAVTRAGDLLSMTATDLGVSAAQGAIFHRFRYLSGVAGSVNRILSLEGASEAADLIQLSSDAFGNGRVQLQSGGAMQFSRSYGNLTAQGIMTVGVSWGGGSARLRFGASAAETIAAAGPADLVGLALGNTLAASAPSNCWHMQTVAFGSRLDDAAFDAVFERVSSGL